MWWKVRDSKGKTSSRFGRWLGPLVSSPGAIRLSGCSIARHCTPNNSGDLLRPHAAEYLHFRVHTRFRAHLRDPSSDWLALSDGSVRTRRPLFPDGNFHANGPPKNRSPNVCISFIWSDRVDLSGFKACRPAITIRVREQNATKP